MEHLSDYYAAAYAMAYAQQQLPAADMRQESSSDFIPNISRDKFMSVFKEEMEVAAKLEKALESVVNDLELMGRVMDEFDLLQRKAQTELRCGR